MYINTMAAPLLMGGLMGLPARYLGWYGIGEKPIRLLKELFMPLLDALTPHFARVAERAPGRWRRDLWRVMGVVSVANAVLMVSLWFWGRTLIGLLSGARHECSIKVLVWLSPILLVSLVGGILGRCVLLACRRDAELNRIYWGAALTWLTLMGILAWALAPWLNHEQMLLGVAAVAVFNEVLMVGRLMRRSRWLMRDRSSGEGF